MQIAQAGGGTYWQFCPMCAFVEIFSETIDKMA